MTGTDEQRLIEVGAQAASNAPPSPRGPWPQREWSYIGEFEEFARRHPDWAIRTLARKQARREATA